MDTDRVATEVQELLPDYLADARECLDKISGVLLALDRGEQDPELVADLFRQMHIIKGGAGLMGFASVGRVAHAAEDLLGAAKRGSLRLCPQTASMLLEAHDVLRALLVELECRGTTSTETDRVVEALKLVLKEGEPRPPEEPAAADPEARAGGEDSDEVLREFFLESGELVDELDQDLVALEETPHDKDLLNKIFRAAHTLKGSSSFLGFQEISALTHRVEDIFNKLRKDEMALTPEIMDVILEAVDCLKRLLEAAQLGEPGPATGAVLAALSEALEGCRVRRPHGAGSPEEVGASPHAAQEDARSWQSDGPLGQVSSEAATSAASSEAERRLARRGGPRGLQTDQTVRVDVDRLDALVNLVGELVLGKNRLARVRAELEERWEGDEMVEQLAEASSQIDLVASDLQMAVMKTRLVPIDRVFRKFPRMVRDLARGLKKEIRLEIQGEGTELDKSVVEVIGDPLVHLIRNSADHGIEASADRERAGKPREGRIRLSACHEGNHIVVSVEDDGKGMDPEALKTRAVEKGIVTPQEAAAMGTRDALNLIFAPGFSTASAVTNVSGRGVGMDVVRTNIQQVNGTVDVESSPGEGTRVLVRIPLTLAIIQALLVRTGKEVYAVPLVSVVETVRMAPAERKTIDGFPVLRLRDQVLPLIALDELFGVPGTEHRDPARHYVVVLGVEEKRVGLVVDALVGEEEVVIKNLGSYLTDIPGIAGATIRGDGRVTLILDVLQLLELTARRRSTCQTKAAA